ncbi:MAG: L-seryl-tRNA(Sec) selenium transferase [Deltaproteobacteria bacterium]|nr:L-seryl-tRNA(Sec) selenium transferase [Deltaproteobacteria bacterium]
MTNLFRHLPAVDKVLAELEAEAGFGSFPRTLLRDLVGEYLDLCREEIKAGRYRDPAELAWERLRPAVVAYVRMKSRPHFRRVLNGAGVVVHTNLGRSILAETAARAVQEACARYSNLEFSLTTGTRGSRYSHVEGLLCQLTGAEAGLVVNNNAAAVLIVLDTLAKGREVVVSRGQLVEIGGSFRIPEVMAKSGAVLREVGATNRTHAHDYEGAIGENTAALLKVHTSNYRIIGFHKEVPLPELVEIGRRHGLPVIEDLGSGNLFDFSGLGLMPEPTVQQVLASGVDVVSFSGDKLLGGPQAGIILGRREYVDRIKKNPLNRAVRTDKMTVAALEATLRLYLDPDRARSEVPTLRMITMGRDELLRAARRLKTRLARELGGLAGIKLRDGVSRVGGGAFPEQDLPTVLVSVEPRDGTQADDLRERLLSTDPPLVGRIEKDLFCLDPRTLGNDEYGTVARVVREALDSGSGTDSK